MLWILDDLLRCPISFTFLASLNLVCDDSNWVIDSGASYHLTSRWDYFAPYTCGDFGQVLMGNDGSSTIIAIGTVHLETSTGCKLVLRNVGHVPDIKLNLLSGGVLDDEGFNSLLAERKWKLLKCRMVVARQRRCDLCMWCKVKSVKKKPTW